MTQSEPKRLLDGREKTRCVAAGIFFPDRAIKNATQKYLNKAGISALVARRFWENRSSRTNSASETELIRSNVSYLFDGHRTVFSPGRFNTEDFPVLYTAKEAETAKSERFYYVAERDQPFEYVVFSLYASGCMVDLRSYKDGQGVDLSQLPHDDCQAVAKRIREDDGMSCQGVISQSARHSGGSCCNFFEIEGLEPGSIIEHAVLPTSER